MEPDEIVEILKQKGVCVCRNTILNWEQSGLISKPIRGGHGRGQGRFSEYPKEVISQCLRVNRLMNLSKYELVKMLLDRGSQS